MTLQTVHYRLTGISPIILHNGQTADPRNQYSKLIKQISGKRKKTDADLDEMARLEFMASLYQNKLGNIILPGHMLEAALINGAKKHKLGTVAKAAVFVDKPSLLLFDGMNLDRDQLWERKENELSVPCRVQQSKVVRTRFIAEEWEALVELTYEDTLLNQSSIADIMDATGSQVAIGTWRPRHGRFSAVKVNAENMNELFDRLTKQNFVDPSEFLS